MRATYIKEQHTIEADCFDRGDAVLRKLGYRPEWEIYAEKKRQENIAALKVWLAKRRENGLA